VGKSGVYKVINGKLEKVSDEIPNVSGLFDASFKDPYYSHTLGGWIESRQQKRELMKQQGLSEYDPSSVAKKPRPEERAKKIENFVAGYLNDRGVERIKLKGV
jgi:hypothetical protein